jgi:hypothetical protein
VLCTGDGAPVAHADVMLYLTGIDCNVSVVRLSQLVGKTDVQGRFTVTDLPRYDCTLAFAAATNLSRQARSRWRWSRIGAPNVSAAEPRAARGVA